MRVSVYVAAVVLLLAAGTALALVGVYWAAALLLVGYLAAVAALVGALDRKRRNR